MNKETLSRLAKTLGFRILIALLILYTVYHCVAAFSDRVVTDVVSEGIDRITVRGEAVLVRDEQVLTVSGGQHLISYPNPNGAKVNVMSPLAELYRCHGDTSALQGRLTALDRQIDLCEKLPLSDMLSSLPALQREVREQLILNNRLTAAGAPLQTVDTGAFDLLLLLNRIAALTGQSPSASSLIASIRAERQLLLSSALYDRTVTLQNASSADTGGYFFYADTVDGYEDILSRAALADMTAAQFADLTAQPPRTYGNGITVVGKLAASHHWSIVLPVAPDVTERMEAGAAYRVVFTNQQEQTVSMVLDRIVPPGADGMSLLILTAEIMPEGFSYPRFAQVELILEQIEGYRIPETALVESNGRTGVYILERGQVCLRDVHLLSRGEGYVLVYAPTQAEREDPENDTYHYDRYLALSDVVITEGDDLYDGKYIQ